MSNENKAAGGRRGGVHLEMNESATPGTQGPTPSQQVLAKAAQTAEVVDPRGRKIVLKRPTPLAQFRFVEMLGPVASNDRYFTMALPMLFIASIDDEPQPPIARKSELEALIKQLGEDGLGAVQKCLEDNFTPKEGEKDDEIKN